MRRLVLAAWLVASLGLGDARAGSASGVFVETTSLALRDDVTPPVSPGKRKLSFKSATKRDPAANRVVPPARGGPADPTLVGATLVVQGTGGTTDRVQVDLPAAGWSALGSDAKPKGFRYRDRTPGAPVSRVVVKSDLITLRGGGAAFAYSLDEPEQRRVGVRLSFADTVWCADAPAKASGSPPSTAHNDQPGRFTAEPRTPAPLACPVGAPTFTLTVGDGFGSGLYPAGATVHVWAAVRPQDQLVTGWTGDAASLLADPLEWHSTLTMPSRDASVTATIVDRPTTLEVTSFTGTTATAKTVRMLIPPAPRGLVLFLHGTGGSNRFITTTEAFSVALRALESGYGVLGTEAEEAVAGDLDGDGKERWDAALTTTNVDFANLNALVAMLRTSGAIGAATPLFAIGMSNGGATSVSLGAIAALPIAALYPELRFGAVVSHCAQGRPGAVAATATPTAWLLCGNDDNGEVDNDVAIANGQALAARGVPTFVALHPASPLYDARFTREPGVSAATSQALAAELRAAGFVDEAGFFTQPTSAILAAASAMPALLPTFTSLAPGIRNDVVDQVRAMQAEHQMYSDWAARAVAFFDAHVP